MKTQPLLQKARLPLSIFLGVGWLVGSAQAHTGGAPVVRMHVGDTAYYEIKADVAESTESVYNVTALPPSNVATITPEGPFFSYSVGRITIQAHSIGTNTVTMAWAYSPTMASGSFSFTLEVAPFDPKPPTSGEQPHAPVNSDPVNTAIGEFFLNERPDFSLGGPMPLEFRRYYSSLSALNGVPAGPLGINWSHNWEMTSRQFTNGVDVLREMLMMQGRKVKFLKNGSAWTLQKPLDTPYQLRDVGNLSVLMDPNTQRRYAFDSVGRISWVKDRNDNMHSLTYTENGGGSVPRLVSDGLGRQIDFSHTGFQRLTAITNVTRIVKFVVDANQRLSGHQDAEGKLSTLTYESAAFPRSGLLLYITRPSSNRPLTQSYDTLYRVALQTNGAGQVMAGFNYGATQTIITNFSSFGASTNTQVYDTAGRLAQAVDVDGGVLGVGYAASGSRGPVTNQLGQAAQFTYHLPSGYPATVQDELGNTITKTYTAQSDADGFTYYDLTRVDFPNASYEAYTYDTHGNCLTKRDRNGNVWTWTYNPRGQMLTEQNPLGGITTWTYNADGTKASRKDHANNTTLYSYDAFRREIRIDRPDGTFRQWNYDNNDRVLKLTNELGGIVTHLYDNNGRALQISGPLTQSIVLGHDGADRLNSTTDSGGYAQTITYDAQGQQTSLTQNSVATVNYTYDGRGNPIRRQDPRGFYYTNYFDAKNRLIANVTPVGQTNRVEYDAAGRPVALISPLGRTNRLQYSSFGLVTNVINGNGQRASYTFDALGWLTAIELGNPAVKSSFTLNALSEITRLKSPNNENWDLAYDSQGRLTSWTDPLNRQTLFAYNSRNWIGQVTYPGALGSQTLTYNGAGSVTRRLYSDATDLSYTYDVAGRPTGASGVTMILDSQGRITACNGITSTRTAGGIRVKTLTLATGKTITYNYNANFQVTSITDWVGGATTFAYDDAGRLLTITRPNGIVTTYGYDLDNNLTGVDVSGGLSSIALQYDGDRQIVSATRHYPLELSFASAGFSQTIGASEQPSSVTYDALGRATADGVRTYVWDLAGRLTSVTESGQTTSYLYDGFGHVIRRTTNGVSRDFVWDYTLSFPNIAKEQASGVDRRFYVHTPDGMLLYSIDADTSARRYYHFDELGNTAFLTGEGGLVEGVYAYLPYGEMTESGSPTDNLFTFGGKYGVMRESNTGFFRMGLRLYDSQRARFLSRDSNFPLIHPLAANPYAYAGGNPLRYLDPLGTVPSSQPQPQGSALDTAGNIVNTAGGVQDLVGGHVEQAYNLAKDVANATTSTMNPEELASINGATRALKAEEQAAKLNGLVNGRAMKTLGAAGNVVAVVNLGQEASKLKDNFDKTLSNYERTLQNALHEFDLTMMNAQRACKAGHINIWQLQKRFIDAKYQLALRFLEADENYDIDAFSSAWAAYGNTLGNFIPGFGLVTPTFQSTVR